MKKIFLVLIFSFLTTSIYGQIQPELPGIWKIVKVTDLKVQPAPEYILMMDDSVYMQGVDSLGNSESGVSSGRYTVVANTLVLYPTDRIAETRFFKPVGDNRYKYEPKINKSKPQQVPQVEMYLEKRIRKEGE